MFILINNENLQHFWHDLFKQSLLAYYLLPNLFYSLYIIFLLATTHALRARYVVSFWLMNKSMNKVYSSGH